MSTLLRLSKSGVCIRISLTLCIDWAHRKGEPAASTFNHCFCPHGLPSVSQLWELWAREVGAHLALCLQLITTFYPLLKEFSNSSSKNNPTNMFILQGAPSVSARQHLLHASRHHCRAYKWLCQAAKPLGNWAQELIYYQRCFPTSPSVGQMQKEFEAKLENPADFRHLTNEAQKFPENNDG